PFRLYSGEVRFDKSLGTTLSHPEKSSTIREEKIGGVKIRCQSAEVLHFSLLNLFSLALRPEVSDSILNKSFILHGIIADIA
ncbi:MAG TPA: hypothetical protein VGB30_07580, partial [bacterium]